MAVLGNLSRTSNSKLPSINAHNFLRLISLSRSAQHLKPLYSLLTVHGLQSHWLLLREFLTTCFHLGLPRLALSAYGRVEKPRLSLKNQMVRCLSQRGAHTDALRVFSRCRASDGFTFPSVIKSCAALRDESSGKQTHCVALRAGFEKNLIVQTSLVDFYSKCGRLTSARHVFDGISTPDSTALNALIAGYSFNRLDREAVEAFGRVNLEPNSSTLASLIPACSRLGWLEIGKSLHCFSVKSGYASAGDFLVPALISMYAGSDDLSSARSLFDYSSRQESIWNSMISAYTRMKMPGEARGLFREMLEEGVGPDPITFVSVIPLCECLGSESLGESIHSIAVKSGSESQLPVSAALVSMYAKLGRVGSAECVFDQMPRRDRLSWNSLISGYLCNGQWESGLTAFGEMRLAGFDPDEVCVVSLISACSKSDDALMLGQSLHAFSAKKGFGSILNVANVLLAFYSSFCEVSSCFRLFREMTVRSTVSWNTLISSCVRNRETEMAKTVFRDMQREGVDLDFVTLISVIPVFGETKSRAQGMALHCHAIKSGFSQDISLINSLIGTYCSSGDPDSGNSLFESVPQKCVVTWNSILTGLRDHGLHKDVLGLFGRMVRDGKRPNHVTLLSLLPSCDTHLQGKTVHGFAIRTGTIQETPLIASLIRTYSRFENVRYCRALFRIGKKEDISLWNAFMSVHTRAKRPRDAISLFSALLRSGTEPDDFTFRSLTSACVQLNSLKLADLVTSYLVRKGLDKGATVASALIEMYSKCGDVLVSRKLFDRTEPKDSVSWSSMISAYGLHGDGRSALGLFWEMVILGMKPDGGVYSAVLSSCSHSGLAEEAVRVFDSMAERGAEHYGCLVDLLARRGNLREAYEIVQKMMPLKAPTTLLGAVLGGCGVFGEVEIGEEISQALFDLDPQNSGPYVMLHNIYAASGRWLDAEKVRSVIEQRGLRKVPGFSLSVGDGM